MAEVVAVLLGVEPLPTLGLPRRRRQQQHPGPSGADFGAEGAQAAGAAQAGVSAAAAAVGEGGGGTALREGGADLQSNRAGTVQVAAGSAGLAARASSGGASSSNSSSSNPSVAESEQIVEAIQRTLQRRWGSAQTGLGQRHPWGPSVCGTRSQDAPHPRPSRALHAGHLSLPRCQLLRQSSRQLCGTS